jgi:hypothetical protein
MTYGAEMVANLTAGAELAFHRWQDGCITRAYTPGPHGNTAVRALAVELARTVDPTFDVDLVSLSEVARDSPVPRADASGARWIRVFGNDERGVVETDTVKSRTEGGVCHRDTVAIRTYGARDIELELRYTPPGSNATLGRLLVAAWTPASQFHAVLNAVCRCTTAMSEESCACPVCGYPNLDEEPHLLGYQGPQVGSGPSHEICPSCGTHLGYTDFGFSHAELRARWIAGGAAWHSKVTRQPDGWDAMTQLLEAGLVEKPGGGDASR